MKIYRFYVYGVFSIILIIMTSCTNRFTYIPKLNIAGPEISSSTLNINDYKIVDNAAKGEDSFSIIFIIPIKGSNQDLVEGMISNAIDKVCLENNYKFMTNVKVYYNFWYIPFIYGKVTIIIEGEGWVELNKSTSINEFINNIKNELTLNYEEKEK